jgi:TetR/AcrR family transcriptional regulator, cholesterol catabolism regulator
MNARTDKIIDVAIALAEEGGFENIRQRDVAAHAGVALGTLYKRFRSKEDILVAALEREAVALEKRLERKPARGDASLDRAMDLFQVMTRGLCRKPNYARAVLRAMASGVPEVASRIAAYYDRIAELVVAAMRGSETGRLGADDDRPSTEEAQIALILQQLWFAVLVGWSAGMYSQNDALDRLRDAAGRVFRGSKLK